ncbi:hypothetical protein [Streptomyces sp. NPDC057302]|uniref:hypothetical protein n=1 Tax=Streptomyces sp. NPDC057302 TaxID=3346094 RepID=UPI00363617E6
MRRGMRNVLGASTAALCLGGLLAACGGGDGDGYVATGPAAAGPERAAGKGVAPTGDVELVPLDGSEAPGGGDGAKGAGGGSGPSEPGSSESTGKSGNGKAGSDSPAAPDSSGPSADGAKPGRTQGSSGGSSTGSPEGGGTSGTPSAPGGGSGTGSTRPSGPTGPTGPAKLSVGEPQRKPAADRWCEKVTVSFKNTGGSPVDSGTVTLGTHVIGALGVDWATLDSTHKLPAPIGAGKTVKKTWPVCVDAWRVPLGMHVETRDVSVKWK